MTKTLVRVVQIGSRESGSNNKDYEEKLVVYFIRISNKFIKIGYSVDPQKRLKELQTGSPTKLHLQHVIPGCTKTEAGLHEMFSHIKAKGEWFKYTEEMKWFIRTLRESADLTNLKTVLMESQKRRIAAKAKRLGPNHKLNKQVFGV